MDGGCVVDQPQHIASLTALKKTFATVAP